MSALSTTSDLLSMELSLPPGSYRFHREVSATPMTMLDNALAENLNGSYKNEAVHTRR